MNKAWKHVIPFEVVVAALFWWNHCTYSL